MEMNSKETRAVASQFTDDSSCVFVHTNILFLQAIQALPWESIPILRKNSVSRSPSMSFLQAQLLYYKEKTENVYSQGVDTRKTYFILNPSNDIPKTQAQFENIFKG